MRRTGLSVVAACAAAATGAAAGGLSPPVVEPTLEEAMPDEATLEESAIEESTEGPTFDLTLRRRIEAPPPEIWQALSEPAAIREWWGPAGYTVPKVEGDFAVGEAMLVCMQGPEGPPMCNSWTYTAIEMPGRLAFDQGWVDEAGRPIDPASLGLPADLPAVVPHEIGFEALEGGGTELSWTERGYASAETAALSRAGLEQVLDKLAASVE